MRLYTQPKSVDVATHAFANPRPWPLRNMTNMTGIVFWQRGDIPAVKLTTPVSIPGVQHWTGITTSPSAQAVAQPRAGVAPWSVVQYTPNGIWGAALNTTGADPVKEHLTTTTIESNWYGMGSPTSACANVFAQDGSGGFRVDFELSVPFAFHLQRNPTTPAAIYASLSVYLRSGSWMFKFRFIHASAQAVLHDTHIHTYIYT